MAGLDHNIYFQQQPVDFLGNVQKGLGMRDDMNQRKFQQAERDRVAQERANQLQVQNAYQSGFVENPDGSTSYDPTRVQNALGALTGNPMAGKEMFGLNQTMTDQNRARSQQEFDNKLRQQTSDTAAANARGEADYRKTQIAKMQAEIRELDRKPGAKALTGENLPLDQKKMVETLSTGNAGKIAIKNQIDAVMGNWDQYSDDQKLAQGRQLLKTLNSTEGKDAIGAEEANRLGSKLEFAMGNFSNSNPTQFGRDLPGFAEQAINTSKNIGDAVNANQRQIDGMMGRPTDFINPVQVIAPDGTIRTIPKNQLQNALANGGKLVGNGG